jgi:hypothetical protein
MQKSGDLIQLLEGIFRYWFMNIHPKRRKKGKLDREHNQFISTQDWEPKWGHDFIKKWANFVEDDMTDEMKDQFQVDVSGKMSLSELYTRAKRKSGRID